MTTKPESKQRTTKASFCSLPLELRQLIYGYLVEDFLDQFSFEQLGALFLETGEYRCADRRPTRVRRKQRAQLFFTRVCRSCILVAQELPALFFDRAVPELVCSGKRLSGMLMSARDPVLLDQVSECRGRLTENLRRFTYFRLSLLCDSAVDGPTFLSLLYQFRDPQHRIGLHIALEDLAVALHGNEWFFNAPEFDAAELRELLWDPRVALFVYRGGMSREPSWAWAYRGKQKLTERVLHATCTALSLNKSLILSRYEPRLMRIGGPWEMRLF